MPEDALLEAPAIDDAALGNTGEDDQTIDATPVDGETVEGEVEPEESQDSSEEEEQQATPGIDDAPDGRKMPDALKKDFAALRAVNSEAAKKMKEIYWKGQEYGSVFPLPADAIAAKQFIDEIGGQDGYKELQAEREEWGNLDKAYAEAPADFVKSIAENNPDAFLKVAPQAINEWAQRAPGQYAYYANTVTLNSLANAGISVEGLASAYSRYADNPQAQAIIAEVHNSLLGMKEKTSQFEQKRSSVDPERTKLQEERSRFETERRGAFENGVASRAETYLTEKLQPAMDRVINGRKIDPDALKGYQKMVKDEVMSRLAAIPGFADKLEAHYRTGNAEDSVKYVQTQYDRILPEAAKVIAPFLRDIKPGVKAPTTAAGIPGAKPAAAGEVTLREMPDHSQIDFNKCTVADVMQGKAVLKNGKRASGWA